MIRVYLPTQQILLVTSLIRIGSTLLIDQFLRLLTTYRFFTSDDPKGGKNIESSN